MARIMDRIIMAILLLFFNFFISFTKLEMGRNTNRYYHLAITITTTPTFCFYWVGIITETSIASLTNTAFFHFIFYDKNLFRVAGIKLYLLKTTTSSPLK